MKKIYTLLSFVLFSFAASAQCSDIFISEVAEGSSNNKYIEFYNGTSDTIDLSDYAFPNVSNAPSTAGEYEYWNTFDSGAVILPNDVYVVAHGSADSAGIGVHADQFYNYLSNGDDGFKLVKGGTWIDADSDEEIDAGEMTGFTVVDVVGDWQARPSGGWDVAGVTAATKDHTLIRKAAFGGNSSWTSSAGTDAASSEWTVMSKDDWAAVGTHSSDCYPPTATEPSTAAADPTAEAVDVISIYSQSYTDPAGINYFPNWGQNPQGSVFEIGMESMIKYPSISFQGVDFNASEIDASAMEYLHLDIWTADVDSFMVFPISRSGENSVTKSLTKGSWTSLDIPLSDYTSQGLSMSDIFQLKLEDPANSSGTVFVDNIYFWKMPTLVYNVADIADIIGLDADFSPVNLDTLYEVTGIVYGIDFQGGDDVTNTNLSFTIIDATDGIGVFNETALDYVVKEGDEVTVKGKLGIFAGLTQIIADSITVVSTGNAIKDPTDVTSLSEDTESDLVMLTKVWLADDTETVWPSNGNIDVTNGVETMTLRIDSDTKGIAGKTIENDTMNIVGLGGQFKFSAPFEGGHQLFPRDSSDITAWSMIPNSVTESVIETRVYPNPTSNNLTVIGTQKWNTYQVFNILGGIVLEGSLSNNNLTVSELNTGTYIVKLYAGENTGVARFVVNR